MKHKQRTQTVLVPADVLAILDRSQFHDRSHEKNEPRTMVMIPDQNAFYITDDLQATANILGSMFELNEEQSLKAASYLHTMPMRIARAERAARAAARTANAGWANWKPIWS